MRERSAPLLTSQSERIRVSSLVRFLEQLQSQVSHLLYIRFQISGYYCLLLHLVDARALPTSIELSISAGDLPRLEAALYVGAFVVPYQAQRFGPQLGRHLALGSVGARQSLSRR